MERAGGATDVIMREAMLRKEQEGKQKFSNLYI